MTRSALQLAVVPCVAAELHRCRHDIKSLGLTDALARAETRSERPLPLLQRRLTPEELSGVVLRLAGTTALSASCLRRSLALWVLLRRSRREPILRIGVPRVKPRSEMHAWIELDGIIIGDRQDIEAQFLPFDLRGKLPDSFVGR
jgi:hypothetical protein